jgi:tRNA threonylcarbamoyl adenosine modification protein YeaZ
VLTLGIETSGICGSVALLRDETVLAFERHEEPNAHAEHILPMLRSALSSAGCAKSDISRVAVGTGPGHFTGLRVGIALCHGLCVGLGVPAVGVCSLAAVAHSAGIDDAAILFVLRDARKNEVFGAAFDSATRPLVEPCLIGRIEVVDWLRRCLEGFATSAEDVFVIGDGLTHIDAARLASLGVRTLENGAALQPDARHVAVLGARCKTSDWPLPAYVREVDAVMPELVRNPLLAAEALISTRKSTD